MLGAKARPLDALHHPSNNYYDQTFPILLHVVHHGQRRHLLAAHKIIHGEVEKVINENIPPNKDAVATADDDQLNMADG